MTLKIVHTLIGVQKKTKKTMEKTRSPNVPQTPGIVEGFFEFLHFLIVQELLAALRHDQRSHVLPAS